MKVYVRIESMFPESVIIKGVFMLSELDKSLPIFTPNQDTVGENEYYVEFELEEPVSVWVT